jgi:hypothetical protein
LKPFASMFTTTRSLIPQKTIPSPQAIHSGSPRTMVLRGTPWPMHWKTTHILVLEAPINPHPWVHFLHINEYLMYIDTLIYWHHQHYIEYLLPQYNFLKNCFCCGHQLT